MNIQSKDQTCKKRIFDGYHQRTPKNDIRFPCVGLCDTRVTGPLWANLPLGECHIFVGPQLNQWFAGYTVRWANVGCADKITLVQHCLPT